MAYEARPKTATGPLPLILVVHQNMGLNEHIRDVARRYAKEGYMASALDLLSREGGTAKVAAADASKIPSLLASPDATTRGVADFAAAADYYAKQAAQVNPAKLGLNGFCFGGGIVWRAAEQIPTLKAAVPFYGAVPPLDQVKNIKAAMFGVYSADPQDFANAKRDDLETALKAANVTYQVKVYPGTQHAFNDDTTPRYNQTQALAAWKDALDWFAKYVKG
jgi:carboxymethylenebutenolidase